MSGVGSGGKGGGISPPRCTLMLYGYIRVSTDKQTVENQRFEILRFCHDRNFGTPVWVEETISGTKSPNTRQLGSLINRCTSGDTIVCSELSRLGRSLFMIISVLNTLLQQKVELWTIKDNFHLGDDLSSKVIAFAFGLSAEIERSLISQRTREALARRKASGVKLGPPFLLVGREKEVLESLKTASISSVARKFGVSPSTIDRVIRDCGVSCKRLRNSDL